MLAGQHQVKHQRLAVAQAGSPAPGNEGGRAMVAFPTPDDRRSEGQRRDEVSDPGEMSPQVRRALQVAAAARMRAARIRAEYRTMQGEGARPPGRPPSPERVAPSARTNTGRLEPAAAVPVPPDRPADIEPRTSAASPPAHPVEPSSPPAQPASAPSRPRFARTEAAARASRLSGWAIEPQPGRPRGVAPGPVPAAEAPKPDRSTGSPRRMAPGRGRRTRSDRPLHGPEDVPAGRGAPGGTGRAPQRRAPAASETSPDRRQPGRRASAARARIRAAYRSVRNPVAFVLGAAIVVALLAACAATAP